ncbi:hypothetical protein FA13DRAFT_1743143 [Coprinellus micaceus]|uniref:Uncharacterized protein n=1 Tax=Coprinellus micaceus TaxID=71717 RepID=A0A4Y7SEV9_COPMI|nr:hypothetical protein FA13DRAFT_1743143 [Coprinellus micaceus]
MSSLVCSIMKAVREVVRWRPEMGLRVEARGKCPSSRWLVLSHEESLSSTKSKYPSRCSNYLAEPTRNP